ncbi:MAG: 16S rRNA (uracil(1498)-N(3))-methyltransferase [Comamonadaceae bacterium]|nr:16S rRNA (uracil(1498)-N(3))-methyltransferase [Comamonadaceae bacterium]
MPPRFHVSLDLTPGAELALPPGAARHVQVLRLQPGSDITLFNGQGGEWRATVTRMGRSDVHVRLGEHLPVEREAPRPIHLLTGLMASERMDWLVEKATELGAASLTPVHTQHCALRLTGERAAKKQAHWQAVATAACEQSRRNRLPPVQPPQALPDVLAAAKAAGHAGIVLSLDAQAPPLRNAAAHWPPTQAVALLSGPEGGLSATEEAAARAAGFLPASLGARVLRAETAPLVALAALLLA